MFAKFKIFCSVSVLSFIIILGHNTSSLKADPMISYPGTRARGMGGAFTGIADDSSSVWYNPAGLAKCLPEFAFEWSQAPGRKLIQEATDDPAKKFDAGNLDNSNSNLFISLSGNGFGIYYYSPYAMEWNFAERERIGTQLAQIDERIWMIGLAFADSIVEDKLNFGFTVEHVEINHPGVGHLDSHEVDNVRKYSFDDDSNSITGSIGLLATPIESKQYSIKLKLGGVYRFKSSPPDVPQVDFAGRKLLLGKPESYDFGASLTKSFTSLQSSFIFSIQQGVTKWSGTETYDAVHNDYNKTSMGAEWSIVSKNSPFCISFRAGLYSSTATEKDFGWPDVNAFTAGIGFLSEDGESGLEVAYENRTLSYYSNDEETVSLISVSLIITDEDVLRKFKK